MPSFLRQLCSSRLRQLQSRAHAWICHPVLNNIGFFVNCEETGGKPLGDEPHVYLFLSSDSNVGCNTILFLEKRWASCATCSEKSTDVFDKCTSLTQGDLWHRGQDVCDINPMFQTDQECCYLFPTAPLLLGTKAINQIMICGQKCPSTLLAQSETNLGGYVSRNLLLCSSAPMSTQSIWCFYSN